MDGGFTFTASDGAGLTVHPDLAQAVRRALPAAAAQPDGILAEQYFLQHLVEAMHHAGIILVPRARARSRDSIDADLYSVALSAKYAADQVVHAIRLVLGPQAGRPSMAVEFQNVVDQLTGHAPILGVVENLGALEERLRRLRLVSLGVSMDAPLADEPAPAALPAGDAA